MKKYYKDVYYVPTFKQVTVEEFNQDLRNASMEDLVGINIPTNRRIAMQNSVAHLPHFTSQGKISVHDEDTDKVAFWERYSNDEIVGSVHIVDKCDYYVVEDQ